MTFAAALCACSDIHRTGSAFSRDASAICKDFQDDAQLERAPTAQEVLRHIDRLRERSRRLVRDLRALELPEDGTRETARRVVGRVTDALADKVIPALDDVEQGFRDGDADRVKARAVELERSLRRLESMYMGDLAITC